MVQELLSKVAEHMKLKHFERRYNSDLDIVLASYQSFVEALGDPTLLKHATRCGQHVFLMDLLKVWCKPGTSNSLNTICNPGVLGGPHIE